MSQYTLSQIAIATHGVLLGNGQNAVSELMIDSRKAMVHNGLLFIALRGVNHDGHQFVKELIGKGILHFMVDELFVIEPDWREGVDFVVVKDTLLALQALGELHRNRLNFPILAVTGSNGKTIVKEWMMQLADQSLKVCRSPRSYNSQVGVPLSLWLMEEMADLGIVEAGISKPGEMVRLEKMIHPGMGLITNIGLAHQENFQSVEHKIDEKLSLFENCDTIYYCRDHSVIHEKLVTRFPHRNLISWGSHEESQLRVFRIETGALSVAAQMIWQGKCFDVGIPFSDSASYENIFHALLVLLDIGIPAELLLERVSKLRPVAMRLEKKEGINGCLIINDAYNSDITSLEVALGFLNQQALRNEMSRTVILSDIFQSGIDEHDLYLRVAHLLKANQVTRLFGIGRGISHHAGCFGMDSHFFTDTASFLASGVMGSFHNEVILIKGSRDFSFEYISERLEQKHHQTLMEINLNALAENLNYFRSKLKPETKTLAMVKAFSYGSGSFEIAGLLQHQKVDYLGVAFADEGLELRRAGISLPVIVMNPEKKSFSQMIQYNLEPEVYSLKILNDFAASVGDEGLSRFPVHIKIDTGMNRLGFLVEEVPELLSQLKKYPQVMVKSVFSHLAGSEDPQHDSYTQMQISQFEKVCADIQKSVGYSFYRHILNSAGIERFPHAQFEMVRIGIGLYGVSATNQDRMRNVATLKSYVSQVKAIPEGSTIGYGRRGRLALNGKIAIIPVGYADGLDRRLGNGVGRFLIHGSFVPIVGNVCMDICMVDVSGRDVKEGDEVIIFGDAYPMWKVAEDMKTISYEVLTGISRRVPRVYYQE